MDEINFKKLQKKDQLMVFRVSEFEKEKIKKFCASKNISISDFIRYAISRIIK